MFPRNMKYIIIYPESHQHLGLFNDLFDIPNVKLVVTEQKKIHNGILKKIRKIHLSGTINKYCRLPLKQLWYKHIKFDFDNEQEYCIIVVDAALKALKVDYLNRIFSRPNVRGVLILINSMDADSIGISEIKPDIPKIAWNEIYTFDAKDTEKYDFEELGNCYYSMHNPDRIEKKYLDNESVIWSDAYFTGGLKGGRESLILDVFSKLYNAGVNLNFNLMLSGTRRLKEKLFEGEIHYYTGGWIPYEEVLANVLKSNVIIEILQDGQSGPSLRYYEAICYNKKLLTNNPNITNLPYYNERYMKVFYTADDIDIGWVTKKEKIDYHYSGDFSPTNLLNVVLK